MGWRGGCLAAGLVRSTVCYYCLGGCSALFMCARRSRVAWGTGPVRVLASLLGLLPVHASLAVLFAGCPASVFPPFACSYALPCGLCVPRARSGCPSGPRRVSVAAVCARAPAAYAPLPPSGSVWRAHYARGRCRALLGPFQAVRALPRFLPRSRVPAIHLLGGWPGPFFPLPCLGSRAPLLAGLLLRGGFARCGGGTRAPGGGRLSPGRGAPGVGRSPAPGCPSLGRAAGARYRLAVGVGGCRRALASWLCALWGRHEGARGGGVSCLDEGRPLLGAPSRPTARPWGVWPGPSTH